MVGLPKRETKTFLFAGKVAPRCVKSLFKLRRICGALGINVGSLRKFVERIAQAYSEGRLKKSDKQQRHSKSIKQLQRILNYGNYPTLWKYVLALALSRVDLGKFTGDSRLSGLRMKVLGIGVGHCFLTATEDETLELQDSLMKSLEYLTPRLYRVLFPNKPILRMRENQPLFRRFLQRMIRRQRYCPIRRTL